MNLYKLSLLLAILPIVFFLVFFTRNKEKYLWVIFLYTVLSFSADVVNASLKSTEYQYYIFGIFTIAEYLLFAIFFYLNTLSKNIRKYQMVCSLIFIIFSLFFLITDHGTKFDSLPASTESILIISYSLLFFYEELKFGGNTFIYSTKRFWIALAILIYLAASFIFFIATEFLSEKEQFMYWPISIIANIVKNICLSIAFSLKQPKLSTPLKSNIIPEKQQ
jgi:hypothetical protein